MGQAKRKKQLLVNDDQGDWYEFDYTDFQRPDGSIDYDRCGNIEEDDIDYLARMAIVLALLNMDSHQNGEDLKGVVFSTLFMVERQAMRFVTTCVNEHFKAFDKGRKPVKTS